jgi:hypothetical protein
MSEEGGELGAKRRCNSIRRREEVVAAEKEKAGVVDKKQEDGREEDCDGKDGEECGAVSWRGQGRDRAGCNYERNVVHDVDDEVEGYASEASAD